MIELTEQQDKRMQKGRCPFCDGTRFLHGPCGAGSENIRCVGCGKEYYFSAPFRSLILDRDEPGLYRGEFSLRSEMSDIKEGLDSMFGVPVPQPSLCRDLCAFLRPQVPYLIGGLAGLVLVNFIYWLLHANR